MATVWSVLLFLDGAIYDLICFLYDIFDYLSKLNIFKEADYQGIVNRVYIILGLIMLFVLAYSLLRAVINPDEFSKGETSFPNLIKNVVISLLIIVILPTVFTVAFNIQNSILNNDVIPKLILDEYDLNEKNGNGGRLIAFYTFEAFLFPDIDYCKSLEIEDLTVCRMSAGKLKANDGWFGQWGDHITKTDDAVLNKETSFTWYSKYSELVRDGILKYYFPISTAAGIFILWVMANFCFDMAIRVIKLAFYQIIAPIPVVCRILPGGKMKDVFSNWVRQVISIFAEVFIRIGAMTIGVYLINIIVEMFTGANGRYLPNISSLNWAQKPIAMALLIMGAVIFIKQVPKILGDLLKLDTGGMKLGLMDKLAMGGGLLAGAAVGGGASMLAKNAVAAGRNFHATKGKGFWARTGALAGGITSTAAGALSGTLRSGWGAKNAKSFKDMKGAAGKGVADATKARKTRAAYKASHSSVTVAGRSFDVGKIPLVGGMIGSSVGHAQDAWHGAKGWLGIDNMQSLIDDNKLIDDISSKRKSVKSAAEDLLVGESNKAGTNKDFGITSTFSNTSNLGMQYQVFNTSALRDLRQKMELAKQVGSAKDNFGVDVSAAEWENLYGQYLKEFSEGVQNRALMGSDDWNNSLIVSDSDRADLSDVRIAAKNLRDSLKANLGAKYIAESGFNASMLDDKKALDVSMTEMKKLGDNLKITKTDNSMKINELMKKQQDSNK